MDRNADALTWRCICQGIDATKSFISYGFRLGTMGLWLPPQSCMQDTAWGWSHVGVWQDVIDRFLDLEGRRSGDRRSIGASTMLDDVCAHGHREGNHWLGFPGAKLMPFLGSSPLF